VQGIEQRSKYREIAMNKRNFTGRIILPGLILLLASCTWEELKVEMRFSPEVGEVYRIDMVMEQEITQMFEDEEMTTEQTLGFGFRMTATSEDEDGSVWIDAQYEWIMLQQTTPIGIVEYDSRNPSEDSYPLSQGLGYIIGKGFAMRVSPSGEILEVTGLDTLLSGLIENLDVEDETLRAQFEEQIQELYSEEALKEQVGNMIVDYPEGEVSIGDTWTASTESTGLVPATIETTYTLEAYEDGIATVSMVSTIQSDPETTVMDMGMYLIKYDLTGTQEGTIAVDTEVGLSVSSVITQDISGEMTLIFESEEISVPITTTSSITIEMVKE
jgi:hypothetical protein